MKKILDPMPGHVITVGKGGVPRLLINGVIKDTIDIIDFSGELQCSNALSRGVLFDGIYVFAAHSLEQYFQRNKPK